MDDADIDLHLNMWVNMADYWMKRMGGKYKYDEKRRLYNI